MKIKNARTTLGPSGAHPAMIYALDVVDRVWRRHTNLHARVTGLAEEGHSERSLHYGLVGDARCRAFDIDASDLTEAQRKAIDAEVRTRLSDLEFDFVWERLETEEAHLHVEFDPT